MPKVGFEPTSDADLESAASAYWATTGLVPEVGLEPTLSRPSSLRLLPLGYPGISTAGGIRTHTGWYLRPGPLPLGYRGARRPRRISVLGR